MTQLGGICVEVRCHVPLAIARSQFESRERDYRHLDASRHMEELWGSPVEPLGVAPLIDIDTSGPVDIPALAERIRVHSQ